MNAKICSFRLAASFFCHGGAALIDCRDSISQQNEAENEFSVSSSGRRAPVCVENECILNARTSFLLTAKLVR
jgi:hypothetical protein